MSFMNSVLNPPTHVTRGFSGTQLGGGNKAKGSFQYENLTPDPIDSSVNSKTFTTWGEKSSWFGLGATTTVRTLEVTDVDANPDLRATFEKTPEGKTELAVTNGSGSRSTELRFDLGTLQGGEIADQLAQARGGSVKVSYEKKGDREEATVTVGDQGFTFATK